MPYFSSGGLGLAPAAIPTAVSVGTTVWKTIFGSGGPDKPFPWDIRTVHGKPYGVKLIFGTKGTWFTAWSGLVSDLLASGTWLQSGRAEDRAWRAFVADGVVYIQELLRGNWVDVAEKSIARIIEELRIDLSAGRTRYVAGFVVPTVAVAPVSSVEPAAGMPIEPVTGSVGGAIPLQQWLILGGALGLGIYILSRN